MAGISEGRADAKPDEHAHGGYAERALRTEHVVVDVWVKGQRRSLDFADAPIGASALVCVRCGRTTYWCQCR